MRMQGKLVIVTGGAGSLGEAQCLRLAAEGARVVVVDLDGAAAQRLADQIGDLGGSASAIVADVTSSSDWQNVLDSVLSMGASVDALVNNAGLSGLTFADDADENGWDVLVAVNAKSVYLGTTIIGAHMAERGSGSIINFSSIVGIVGGTGGHPGYYAAKGAVRSYSKAAAVRLGPSNVRVNSLHPGYMPAMKGGSSSEADRGARLEMIPLGRLGSPEEVANGVLFLASDESTYVTGSELIIDGGFLAR